MFDGNFKTERKIARTTTTASVGRNGFLETTRKQREDRSLEKRKANAFKSISRFISNKVGKHRRKVQALQDISKKIIEIRRFKSVFSLKSMDYQVPSEVVLHLLRESLFIPQTAPTRGEVLLGVLLIANDSISAAASAQFNVLYFMASQASASSRLALALVLLNILETLDLSLTAPHLAATHALLYIFSDQFLSHSSGAVAELVCSLADGLVYSLCGCAARVDEMVTRAHPSTDCSAMREILLLLMRAIERSAHRLLRPTISSTLTLDLAEGLRRLLRSSPRLVRPVACALIAIHPQFMEHLLLSSVALNQLAISPSLRLLALIRGYSVDVCISLAEHADKMVILSNLCLCVQSTQDQENLLRNFLCGSPRITAHTVDVLLRAPLFAVHLSASGTCVPTEPHALNQLIEGCVRTTGEIEDLTHLYEQSSGVVKLQLCAGNKAFQRLVNDISNSSVISSSTRGGEASLVSLNLQPALDLLTHKDLIIEYINGLGSTAESLESLGIACVKLFALQLMILQAFADNSLVFSFAFPALSQHSSASLTSYLNSLSFCQPQNPLCVVIWRYFSCIPSFEELVVQALERACTECLQTDAASTQPLLSPLLSLLYLFCVLLSHQLSVIDDEEFVNEDATKLFADMPALLSLLKRCLYVLYWSNLCVWDPKNDLFSTGSTFSMLLLQSSITKLFNHLYVRDERIQMLGSVAWLWQINEADLLLRDSQTHSDEGLFMNADFVHKNSKAVLLCIPQVLPFHVRVKLFQSLLAADRSRYQNELSGFVNAADSLRVEVRRTNILEDSFNSLHSAGKMLRSKIRVNFISDHGVPEAGIDGGGLFKEFIDMFCKEALSPANGLFTSTSNNTVIPCAADGEMSHQNRLEYFSFVGKMVGKAVYERILVESQFSGSFLNFLVARRNELDDLVYLDTQIYKSLLQLKKIAAKASIVEMEALGLSFEVSKQTASGETVVVELIPRGSITRVTKDNYRYYIHRFAHYKLNEETLEQNMAFLRGFRELIPLDLIRLFSAQEVQLLISGDQRAIDVRELQNHTVYAGGYHPSQPYIQEFWRIVERMTPQQHSNLLKFVTSCSRQPLLGFGQLNPPFGIQRVPLYSSGTDVASEESSRLPTASTCFNLLKLPQYETVEELQTKLAYAITANSGFDLT